MRGLGATCKVNVVAYLAATVATLLGIVTTANLKPKHVEPHQVVGLQIQVLELYLHLHHHAPRQHACARKALEAASVYHAGLSLRHHLLHHCLKHN